MNLTALTRDDVRGLADNSRVFAAGLEYEREGMISRFAVTPTGITARVHGNYGEYTVTVTPEVRLRCTCPYEGTTCKHKIAVLLHYLEGDYTALSTEAPTALEATLEKMPEDALRTLLVRLIRNDAEVRRALLEAVPIAPALLRGQPSDPKQVKALKKAVDKAFTFLERDYDYEEDGRVIDLDFVFSAALPLNPDDQTDVLWYIVEQGNANIEEYGLDTEFLERALGQYALAVARLALPAGESKYYLDTLIEGLHWTMCGYGDVAESIHEALTAIAMHPEDVRYVIGILEKSEDADARDWAIGLYRKLGDDAAYLAARHARLDSEGQYLELADFYTEIGKPTEALQTLEGWVSRQAGAPERGVGELLRRLVTHYTQTGGDANLCRILMEQTRQHGLTLESYSQIKTLAERLGTWAEHRPTLLNRAQGLQKARILVAERNWPEALAFANQPRMEERVRSLVADAVKEERPEEALALYDGLVQANIGLSNRGGYAEAARYAAEVAHIYRSIANDPAEAKRYVAAIRAKYPRHRALQEEFKKL